MIINKKGFIFEVQFIKTGKNNLLIRLLGQSN